jgi:hypothetical protein
VLREIPQTSAVSSIVKPRNKAVRQFGFGFIKFGKSLQCFIKRNKFGGFFFGENDGFFELGVLNAAAFHCQAVAGVINKNAPHYLR